MLLLYKLHTGKFMQKLQQFNGYWVDISILYIDHIVTPAIITYNPPHP